MEHINNLHFNMPCIYHVYTICITCINIAYILNMLCIFMANTVYIHSFCFLLHASFRDTHLPPALTSSEFEDNIPDQQDKGDLTVPNTQAHLDSIILNMSKIADAKYNGLCVLLHSLPVKFQTLEFIYTSSIC